MKRAKGKNNFRVIPRCGLFGEFYKIKWALADGDFVRVVSQRLAVLLERCICSKTVAMGHGLEIDQYRLFSDKGTAIR